MRHQLLVVRILAVVALAVSAAQLADSLTDAGAFCGFEGDCETVTASVYGRPLGIPLPAVGVVGFALLFGLSLLPEGRGFALLRPLAVVAGLVGVGLLVVQFAVLRRVCPLCVIVDVCAVGMAVAVLVRRPEPAPPVRLRLAGWVVLAVAAVFIPLAWSVAELPPPPPEQVKAHWQAGRVTVVEVTDFECPHCQRADAILKDVLTRHNAHFVRLPAPMPKHENARPAARAYLAALRQGKGEEMAAALFAADSRTPARCRELAAGLGLNLAEYDRVVSDFATDTELNDTIAWAKNTGSGLPLIWVQERRFDGVPAAAALETALRRAKPFER